MNNVLVVAPHPDDETLGCSGTILKHKDQGDKVFWLLATKIHEKAGFSEEKVAKRSQEIDSVSKEYGFESTINLDILTATLDSVKTSVLISKVSEVQKLVKPNIVYFPHFNDVHSDHRILARAIHSSIKWFRYPYIRKAMMYEVPSETEFNFLSQDVFRPNIFVDITDYLERKITIIELYKGESEGFPFPRSEETMRALATLRGSQSGYKAAEAFQLVFERS